MLNFSDNDDPDDYDEVNTENHFLEILQDHGVTISDLKRVVNSREKAKAVARLIRKVLSRPQNKAEKTASVKQRLLDNESRAERVKRIINYVTRRQKARKQSELNPGLRPPDEDLHGGLDRTDPKLPKK